MWVRISMQWALVFALLYALIFHSVVRKLSVCRPMCPQLTPWRIYLGLSPGHLSLWAVFLFDGVCELMRAKGYALMP